MAEIKKTMVNVLEFVTANGNMSKENLDIFTNEFCVAKSRTTSTGPREFVKLFNEDGEVLARRCSVTHKWLLPDDFNGDIAKMSVSREANKAKTKNVRAGEAIEREALNILTEARSETDATAKLELFEKYDSEMEKAKQIKTADVEVEFELSFDSIEEVAEHLEVPIITSAPKAEDGEEA